MDSIWHSGQMIINLRFRGVWAGQMAMSKAHRIGTLAAIGGLTATIALLTGLPTIKADELADLRANQELLQRRIDQLAQAATPAPPLPGTRGGGAAITIPGMAPTPTAPSL